MTHPDFSISSPLVVYGGVSTVTAFQGLPKPLKIICNGSRQKPFYMMTESCLVKRKLELKITNKRINSWTCFYRSRQYVTPPCILRASKGPARGFETKMSQSLFRSRDPRRGSVRGNQERSWLSDRSVSVRPVSRQWQYVGGDKHQKAKFSITKGNIVSSLE